MSPLTELGLVLLGLHVLEGVRRAPSGTFAFSRKPWGGYRLERARSVRERTTVAFVLPSPWVPALERFVVSPWPFAVSPEGVATSTASPALDWEAAGGASVLGSKLRFPDGSLVRAGSPERARRWAETLRELARLAPGDRERAIRDRIARSFDAGRVRSLHESVESILKRARPIAWLLSVNLFVAGPVLSVFLGWGAVLPGWALAHFALTAWAVVVCRRAARARADLSLDARFETVVSMGLYPPAAARFLESFPAGTFDDVDPVAAASELLDRGALVGVARARLADSAAAGWDRPVEAWFDDVVRREIARLLSLRGLSEAEVLAPPPRESGSRAYCPRCRVQYRSEVTTCADCASVGLIPYEADSGGTFQASEVAS